MNPTQALRAAELPARWHGRDRCVVLTVGAAAAPIAQAIVDAWRSDPSRCTRLHIVIAAPSAAVRVDDWLPVGSDWQLRRLDGERVQVLHVPGASPEALPGALRALVAQADVLFVADGGSMHAARALARSCARVASADAVLVTPLHAGDASVAFEAEGFMPVGGGHASGASPAVYRRDARVPVRIPPAWRAEGAPDRHAIVVGGGLAGCATAWALAMQGWRCTLLEAAPTLGGTAAAQPASVFHPIVHAADTRHARFARAGAREARDAVALACARHGVRGAAGGLLQLIDDADVDPARARLEALGIGSARMHILDAAAASVLAGTPLARAACWQADGGWVDAGGLARSFLERAGAAVEVRAGVAVDALERLRDGWSLRDRTNRSIGEAHAVVLANAGDAFRLIGGHWPVAMTRGQSSLVAHAAHGADPVPALPLAGGGYVAPTGAGGFVFGATSQPDDASVAVRRADHLENVARLAAIAPALARDLDVDALQGRAGTRCVARDRLPLVGRVPDAGDGARRDVLRLVPRRPGLWMHAALGARGVAWCALGAQALAALMSGTPVPLSADLLEAIDPARFGVRDRRRPVRR